MKTFTLKQCSFKIADQRSDFVAVFCGYFLRVLSYLIMFSYYFSFKNEPENLSMKFKMVISLVKRLRLYGHYATLYLINEKTKQMLFLALALSFFDILL